MNIATFTPILKSYANTLRKSGAKEASIRINKLLKIFKNLEDKTVDQLLKKASSVSLPDGLGQDNSVEKTITILKNLHEFSSQFAKKGFLDDLDRTIKLLTPYKHLSISELSENLNSYVVSAFEPQSKQGQTRMDHDLVEKYLELLEQSLQHKQAFKEIFDKLKSDKAVTKLEAIELANRFTGQTAASTSRQKALEKVFYRHKKLMDFEEGSASIGRTAAR